MGLSSQWRLVFIVFIQVLQKTVVCAIHFSGSKTVRQGFYIFLLREKAEIKKPLSIFSLMS